MAPGAVIVRSRGASIDARLSTGHAETARGSSDGDGFETGEFFRYKVAPCAARICGWSVARASLGRQTREPIEVMRGRLRKRSPGKAPSIAPPARQGSHGMRLMIATAAIVAALNSSAKAAADANQVKDCSDRNALNSIAVDARLVAIKFFYNGFIHGMTDRHRQTCFEARVLNDDRLAIVNKTLDLIERDCLPIETAARIALEGACP
jgi:hypothetical protein